MDSVRVAWVQKYGAQQYYERDDPSAIAVDRAGNVYVTGTSGGTTTLSKTVTIKYRADGTVCWTAHYPRTNQSISSYGSAIAIDSSGNVYVAGLGPPGGVYVYIVKYDSLGNESWTAHFHETFNNFEMPSAIAVDRGGNVYLACRYDNEIGFLTLKYNASGTLIWSRRYRGSTSGGPEHPTCIALDNSSNVFVAGVSTNPIPSITTIKYNSDGDRKWVALYSGGGYSNLANAIAIDRQGNVCVTGRSSNVSDREYYTTIKYSNSGERLWVARYDTVTFTYGTAYSLGIDSENNIVVTGTSGRRTGRNDLATVKYSPTGVQLWVARFDSVVASGPYTSSLTIDPSDNIIVVGNKGESINTDFAITKYSPSGSQQWIATYNGTGNSWDSPRGITADKNGNILVTGLGNDSTTQSDFVTLKYNSSGVPQWTRNYDDGPTSLDGATSMVVDRAENLYVTGPSASSRTREDFVTVKYNSQGIQQWVRRYDGPGHGIDYPRAMAIDSSGNVVVTGESRGLTSGTDYATVKYNPNGNVEWIARYNGAANSSDDPWAIAADRFGNVYVTGSSTGVSPSPGSAITTVKYNATGVQQWVRRYAPNPYLYSGARAITVDAEANVYVAGSCVPHGSQNNDYVTIKYNTDGVQQWAGRFDGSASRNDFAWSIAVSRSGSVYVTGGSEGRETNFDFVTLKYNATGVQQWVREYNWISTSYDYASYLLLDHQENICVAGTSSSINSNDLVTIKYDSSGTMQWLARYDEPSTSYRDIHSLAVDEYNNVYLGASSSRNSLHSDYLTIKYSSSGILRWTATYGDSMHTDRIAKVLADGMGNVYVAGTEGGSTGTVFTTIKYAQTPLSVDQIVNTIPSEFHLAQNYPNPFNLQTTITVTISTSERADLRVYDILGSEVATLFRGSLNRGKSRFTWDAFEHPSGVYFYRLSAGQQTMTKKMILIR